MGFKPSLKRLIGAPRHVPLVPSAGISGWSLPARLLRIIIDTAFMASVCLTVLFAIVSVVAIFLPLNSFSITIDDGANARQMPLTRTLVLFVMAVVTTYFAGTVAILHYLRLLFRTLLAGDPFQPANILRLRLIGAALAFVTLLGWGARMLVAQHLAVGAIDTPGIGELITPAFAIIITFTLAELFREGARLRRETELTI
ncbi:DUF2975 domain-containing protein [Brevundimonas terrae]|uniref:DUF2975 domain-containing protein n=1 Tax=Brevundimonas terrae TaxID=363631 RepID=A0ABN0Y313_9CAUL|nr:DUF2975 domain-containing protein [Brevundimonas terrae]NIJ25967.1 hypothetical protein [Brevundimonas terrae]